MRYCIHSYVGIHSVIFAIREMTDRLFPGTLREYKSYWFVKVIV
jgi:hypothetical protein